MYHALYRKYRPHDFDSVVGQQSIIRTLKNSIINGTFTHAYLFFGPRGTGKTTISKIFARNVNCLEPIDGISCGKCANCVASYDKECVDIIEIDAASNNGVNEIRELKSKISLVPAELKYKVYIIDEVHMLSIGAFNALLKTLEEPPEHVIFILATTDLQKVPETIISRCQCFSFKRISPEMIVERLKYVSKEEKIDIDDDVLDEIAMASDGGMRDALGMLDKLCSYSSNKITVDDFAELNGLITRNELLNFSKVIFDDNIAEILNKINKYNSDGKNLIQIMSQLMLFLRNMIVNYYINDTKLEFSIEKMQNLINLINENMFDIKRSENPKISIEMLFIKFVQYKSISENKVNNASSGENITANNAVVKEKNVKKDDNNLEVPVEIKNSEYSVENNNILETKNNFEKYEDKEEKIDIADSNVHKIINLNDIIDVRVNNTLAEADKSILKIELENFNLLNDFTFDQEIGYIVCSLLDAKLRAASEKNIILSYEDEANVDQNLAYLDKITEVYNKITNSNKNIAIITDKRWDDERTKYIKALKEGKKYEIEDEPEEVFEEIDNDDIISTSNAVALFGDIVEIE